MKKDDNIIQTGQPEKTVPRRNTSLTTNVDTRHYAETIRRKTMSGVMKRPLMTMC